MRTLIIGLTAALTLGGLAACSSSKDATCENPVATTTVEVNEFTYDPSCVQAEAGATLTIDNAGQVPHTYTVTGTDATVDVAAGESATLDVSGLAPGVYRVICTYHSNMESALKVG